MRIFWTLLRRELGSFFLNLYNPLSQEMNLPQF